MLRSVNSYLGIMAHTASYRLRRRLFFRREFLRLGAFDRDMTKLTASHSALRFSAGPPNSNHHHLFTH